MSRKNKILWGIVTLLFIVAIVLTIILLKEKKQESQQTTVKIDKTEEKEENEETLEETEEVEIFFAGDVLLSDYVLNNYNSTGIEGVLGDGLRNEMRNADLTVVNEEFPFGTTGTKAKDKQFTFRVNPTYITIFQEMGIDAVTLANNHILDFGDEALEETMKTLDEAGIAFAGAGDSKERASQLQKTKINGKIYGMLAVSRVIPVASWNIENHTPGVFCTYDSGLLIKAIEKAREECDYLAVYVHWGIERNSEPEEYQRTLAKQYIDAGADAVIGSHPHVLQGIEFYQGKPIFYSLGNFIFNQSIQRTAGIKFVISTDGDVQIRLLAASAQNACTELLDGRKAQEIYQYIESISFGVAIDEQGIVSKNQ